MQQASWHMVSTATHADKSQKEEGPNTEKKNGHEINVMKKIITHYPFKISCMLSALPMTALTFLQFTSVC